MKLSALLSALLVLGLSQVSHGTTVILVSIPELFAASDIVFEGTLRSMRNIYVDHRPYMLTEYKFDLKKIYNGKAERAEVILRVPGGSDGQNEVIIDGMPHFEKSDIGKNFIIAAEAVYSDKNGYYLPYGLTQGVFWQSADKEYIYRHLSGNAMYLHPMCMGGEGEEQFQARELYHWLEQRAKVEVGR